MHVSNQEHTLRRRAGKPSSRRAANNEILDAGTPWVKSLLSNQDRLAASLRPHTMTRAVADFRANAGELDTFNVVPGFTVAVSPSRRTGWVASMRSTRSHSGPVPHW